MKLKKLPLLIITTLFCVSAKADFEYLDSNNETIYSADFSTLKITDGYVQIWTLEGYTKPLNSSNGISKSSKSLMVFDCSKERRKSLTGIFYTELFGGGDVVSSFYEPTDWRYAAPGTIGFSVMEKICKKAKNKLLDKT